MLSYAQRAKTAYNHPTESAITSLLNEAIGMEQQLRNAETLIRHITTIPGISTLKIRQNLEHKSPRLAAVFNEIISPTTEEI